MVLEDHFTFQSGKSLFYKRKDLNSDPQQLRENPGTVGCNSNADKAEVGRCLGLPDLLSDSLLLSYVVQDPMPKEGCTHVGLPTSANKIVPKRHTEESASCC